MLIPKNIPSQVKGSEGAKDEEMLKAMNNSMMYMMPVMTVVIGAKLPGGLTLYWVMVTLISVFQQWLVLRKKKQQQQAA
jgi:membrane protein insertase Oxa1/YidC/SpoIIIJ